MSSCSYREATPRAHWLRSTTAQRNGCANSLDKRPFRKQLSGTSRQQAQGGVVSRPELRDECLLGETVIEIVMCLYEWPSISKVAPNVVCLWMALEMFCHARSTAHMNKFPPHPPDRHDCRFAFFTYQTIDTDMKRCNDCQKNQQRQAIYQEKRRGRGSTVTSLQAGYRQSMLLPIRIILYSHSTRQQLLNRWERFESLRHIPEKGSRQRVPKPTSPMDILSRLPCR